MSYPKRAKGWRKITVDGQQFRWHFDTLITNPTGKLREVVSALLKLQGPISNRQQVFVTMHDWFDVYDFIGHYDKVPNFPSIVTARFARQAIQFALSQGWNPQEAGPPIHIDYTKGVFSILSADGSVNITQKYDPKPQNDAPISLRFTEIKLS